MVSAEQSFHRRLAEYEMLLGSILQVAVVCIKIGHVGLAVFSSSACINPKHQTRNIEQQKLFREDSSF